MAITNRKHIARSGAKAGQWVNCTATKNCTLGGLHIKEQQLFATAVWLEENGKKKLMKDITGNDVQGYLKLNDAGSPEWDKKARLHALKTKGIKGVSDDYDPFINDAKSFEEGLKRAQFLLKKSQGLIDQNEQSIRAIEQLEENVKRISNQLADNPVTKAQFVALTEAEKAKKLEEKLYGYDDYGDDYDDDYDDHYYEPYDNDKYYEKRNSRIDEAHEKFRKQQAEERAIIDAREKAELAELGSNKVIKYNNDTVLNVETFETLKLEVIENGGDLTFSSADVLEYSDGRPSEVRIKNLRATGKMEFLTDLGKKIEQETNFSRSLRAIGFTMKKKDYENFLNNYSEKNKNIVVYPRDTRIIQKSFGREIVTGSFDVKGKGQGINNLVKDLEAKKQFSWLSMNDALKPTTTTYQEPIADEDSRKHLNKLYRNLKVANEGSNSMLNHEEQHFLERAKSSYLPNIINGYAEIIHSPTTTDADKETATTVFKEQVDAISSKVTAITAKKSKSGLDAMMIELNFLKDRVQSS